MRADSSPAFLGTGWAFPPTFNRLGATVVMAEGETDIHMSLEILFSTRLGERIMLASYGTNLWAKVFGNLTTTFANEIRAIVAKAILDWEPRIGVVSIAVEAMAQQQGWLQIGVDYTIRQTNSRGNFVYPFYLREATFPPPTP